LMLVSRPLTIPKILGGKARGRKKVRMATKWDSYQRSLDYVFGLSYGLQLCRFLRILRVFSKLLSARGVCMCIGLMH
jgi:hypothetical protein